MTASVEYTARSSLFVGVEYLRFSAHAVGGLDLANSLMVSELILRLHKQGGVSQVVVTHDLDIAKRVAVRFAIINDGQIVFDGKEEELRHSTDPSVLALLKPDADVVGLHNDGQGDGNGVAAQVRVRRTGMIRKGQLAWSRLKVGLLFLGTVGLLVVASISIEGSTSLFQTSYRAHFDDVVGLKVGAPVRIAGLDVGHVDDVRLLDGVLVVEVTFSVENSIIDRLRGDASAVVRAMSVLGDKILEILPGTPSQPPLQPDAILPGEVELEIAGIAPSAESTMLNLNKTLLEIRKLVESI